MGKDDDNNKDDKHDDGKHRQEDNTRDGRPDPPRPNPNFSPVVLPGLRPSPTRHVPGGLPTR